MMLRHITVLNVNSYYPNFPRRVNRVASNQRCEERRNHTTSRHTTPHLPQSDSRLQTQTQTLACGAGGAGGGSGGRRWWQWWRSWRWRWRRLNFITPPRRHRHHHRHARHHCHHHRSYRHRHHHRTLKFECTFVEMGMYEI